MLFLLGLNLIASDIDDKYSFRVANGYASAVNLGDIVMGDFSSHPVDLRVTSFDAGYLLKKDFYDLPIDIYLKSGFAIFDESGANRDDVYEGTLYIKAYYNIDFWENRVRFGFAEGISYVTNYLYAEESEAIREGDNYSKFLNYLDISLDFNVGKLVRYKPLEKVYFGYALKHRSGVAGLYNGVRGGSNYNTLYLEANF